MIIDLHLHTSCSDGRLSPQGLVKRVGQLGGGVIAICDHDTVAGIGPALQACREEGGVTLIPAVEISTHHGDDEVHVLGYFVDPLNPSLLSTLGRSSRSRIERAQAMVAKLRGMGMDIDWSRVEELAQNNSIGRPHIARALMEAGYTDSIKEAFERFIGHGGPAYVERIKMTPGEAISLIEEAGGLAVLAHPFTLSFPEAIIQELTQQGLKGLEVYYNEFSLEERGELEALARKYHLLPTGGSDYHGLDEVTETGIGEAGVPEEVVIGLLSWKEKR